MGTESYEADVEGEPRGFDATHRVRVGEDAERPSVAAAEAIAGAKGSFPEPGTLYRAIDPDALDALFESRPNGASRSGGVVSFDAAGCVVTVHADGTVIAAALG